MSETKIAKCPKCYGDVDSRAQVCPHCKNQLKKGGIWQIGSMIGALGLFMLGISLLILLIGNFWAFGFLAGAILLIVGLIIRRQ